MSTHLYDWQDTPNPRAMKVIVDRIINAGPTRSYRSIEQAKGDSLAKALLALKDVDGVMILKDFVTVSRTASARWSRLRPKVEAVLEMELAAMKSADG